MSYTDCGLFSDGSFLERSQTCQHLEFVNLSKSFTFGNLCCGILLGLLTPKLRDFKLLLSDGDFFALLYILISFLSSDLSITLLACRNGILFSSLSICSCNNLCLLRFFL